MGFRYTRNSVCAEVVVSPKQTVVAAVLSDIHFPYEDPAAMRLCKKIIEDAQPQIVILNGDLVDFFGISRFPVPPIRRAEFAQEILLDNEKIEKLRSLGPEKSTWFFLEGNHEMRLQLYLWRRAPEMSELLDVSDVLKLKENNIIYLQQSQEPQSREDFAAPQIKLGKLYVTHGHTIRMWGNAVNVARGIFQRLLKPALVGHWHRKDVYTQTDYEGVLNGAFVQGCLCRPRPHYDTGRIWGQGMSIVFVQNGYFEVDVIEFIAKDKKLFCLWRGKRYETPIEGERW